MNGLFLDPPVTWTVPKRLRSPLSSRASDSPVSAASTPERSANPAIGGVTCQGGSCSVI